MRFPDFLIIGAMKAGTTSLYEDLCLHQRIFMPEEKEPGNLLSDRICEREGQARYAALFETCGPSRLCGEASTAYSKLPDYPGVPDRTMRVIGPSLKVIYLIRDPARRAISHHHYLHIRYRTYDPDINVAWKQHPELLNYSRYHMQISAWLQVYDRSSIKIVTMERLAADRLNTLNEILHFLGLEQMDRIEKPLASNITSELKPLPPRLQRFTESHFYLRRIRPLIPGKGRSKLGFLRRVLRSDPKIVFPAATPETLAGMYEQVQDDTEKVLTLLDENDREYARSWGFARV